VTPDIGMDCKKKKEYLQGSSNFFPSMTVRPIPVFGRLYLS
jgi:hypothetical protein